MTVTCVIGTQWGDEGKGKIVDFLAADCGLVIRFQGSDNAGHTVVNEHGRFGLHLVPSGIFHGKVRNLLGPGTGVNPDSFLTEINGLDEKVPQLRVRERIMIAERAHVIMPYHRTLDGAQERSRGDLLQGTTGRGNGPLYADKHARSGIQIADLFEPEYLRRWLENTIPEKSAQLARMGEEPPELESILERCQVWAEGLAPYVVDSFGVVQEALASDRDTLLEGQLGIMRDINWGHYPYVTSSSPTAGGASIGAGIPPRRIDAVVGVAKAFTSSVGEGPFPTELSGPQAERLRIEGDEFGVATGRPRRVGWMDAVAVRYAVALNGVTDLALTKLDLLDGVAEIPICRAYEIAGENVEWVPNTHQLARARPVYDFMPGWDQPTAGISTWRDLPPNARAYVERVEEIAGAPVRYIGTGQAREDIVCRW
ncbi:MAG: adenylosuccinate synthase [Chloroflexi bacterium]|nr:adenylosuccinate synthase [Chloroflexota bacterium]